LTQKTTSGIKNYRIEKMEAKDDFKLRLLPMTALMFKHTS
jgi:hypothetical protein